MVKKPTYNTGGLDFSEPEQNIKLNPFKSNHQPIRPVAIKNQEMANPEVEETPKTKVCAQPDCEWEGKALPATDEYFYKKGKDPTCKKCRIKQSADRKAELRKYRKEMITKICRQLDCAHAGEEQPIENFQRHARTKDGYSHTWRECMERLSKAGCVKKAMKTEKENSPPDEIKKVIEKLEERKKDLKGKIEAIELAIETLENLPI